MDSVNTETDHAGAPDREERHTVILVHGTFAAPKEGVVQWYQRGSEFCKALDRSLETLHSNPRCWSHLPDDGAVFHWDGRNDWLSRLFAAKALAREVRDLKDAGWHCHIVAHSHGGNVALEAFRLFGLDETCRSITLLGCPVISYKTGRVGRFLCLATLLFIGVALAHDSETLNAFLRVPGRHVFIVGTMIALAALAFCLNVFFELIMVFIGAMTASWKSVPGPEGEYYPIYPKIFHFYSEFDEAQSFLKAVNTMQNPLAKDKDGLRPSILNALQVAFNIDQAVYTRSLSHPIYLLVWLSYAIGFLTVLRLLPHREWWLDNAALVFIPAAYILAVSFVRVQFVVECLELPWRLLLVLLRACRSIVVRVVTPLLLAQAWKTLRAVSLGLLGNPGHMKNVTIGEEYLHHWVEHKVLSGREMNLCPIPIPSSFIRTILADQKLQAAQIATGLLEAYRDGLGTCASSSSINDLLAALEFELVHSVYYKEPKIIDAIALVVAAGPYMANLGEAEQKSLRESVGPNAFLNYRHAINEIVKKHCKWD
ncbi:lipase family protein [Paraburkholderia elongata]|uniref:Uncharacterized protein n=1 Tax=Paraburkholderia elongata TaxID=2675747 RepID=A0A972NL60_9BURK|nr:hypothetical protein [Paraburkholderia elongata]NPT53822.1 hypothetical protein [Paraburkholderia elongata]